jgi:integrase
MLEARTVLKLADAIDGRYRALVLLAGFGGLRTGELLGLERKDIDVLHHRVHVRRLTLEIHGAGRVTMAPKSPRRGSTGVDCRGPRRAPRELHG